MKLLIEALKDYSLSAKSDPSRLRQMFNVAGVTYPLDVNWCGIAMFAWVNHIGYETPDYPEVARRWLKVGMTTPNPKIGDMVILWRESPSSWKGHVSIYLENLNATEILCLGGAQSGSVMIKSYPVNRILGFRKPQPKDVI